jgi:hypothetical protein
LILLLRAPALPSLMENMSEQIHGTVLVVDDDEGVRKVLARWVWDTQ